MSTTTTQDAQNTTQEPQEPAEGTTEPQEPTEAAQEAQEPTEDAETFPRPYVERLRAENAEQRTRARQADELARRLHTELVRASGRLADPTDLDFDEAHLEDVDVMEEAIDELLTRKPHLASRRPVGDVGQGAHAGEPTVDLAGILRANAS